MQSEATVQRDDAAARYATRTRKWPSMADELFGHAQAPAQYGVDVWALGEYRHRNIDG